MYYFRYFFGLTRISFVFLLFATLLCGILYPLVMILVTPNSSFWVEKNDQIQGSLLIGQYFKDPKYFWGRPPQNKEKPYDFKNAQSSHLSPNNPKLKLLIQERMAFILSFEKDKSKKVPIDLLTSSASDLDPHISPEAAFFQAERIAQYRNLSQDKIQQLITDFIEEKSLGFLGERRINVLKLNLALDKMQIKNDGSP